MVFILALSKGSQLETVRYLIIKTLHTHFPFLHTKGIQMVNNLYPLDMMTRLHYTLYLFRFIRECIKTSINMHMKMAHIESEKFYIAFNMRYYGAEN